MTRTAKRLARLDRHGALTSEGCLRLTALLQRQQKARGERKKQAAARGRK